MLIGGVELTVLDAGTFLYDGGAMFGVVPKVIWSSLLPSDDSNRITLSVAPLLIRTEQECVLIDTGFGNRLGKRERKIFGADPDGDVVAALSREGLTRADVDIVVLTHLHIDHAGGATSMIDGELRPTFPNARYVVNSKEWAAALDPNPMSAAAYRRDDFVPLEACGRLELVEGEHAINKTVTAVETGGHTAGHMMVRVDTAEGTAVYPADLLPSRHHVRAPYVASVDLYPLDVIERKQALLSEAVESGWTVVLDHDPGGKMGRIARSDDGRFAFRELEDCA